ncbi:Utp14-domain-containing protein [Agrocybe pediades]|nr:Utp14-domain-containing protein [Agrocybe pediades]
MNSNKRSGRPSGSKSFKNPTKKFGGAKPKSRSEANAAGYEKRLARKGKKPSNDLNDLYEHVESKERRSKVTLDLDRDEEYDYAVGLDSKNEDERAELRARLIGENQDDEEIASEDDEEIDSDAAFEEEDEERFAGFFSAKKNKSKSLQKKKGKSAVRFAEVDLNEDEDMDSDEGGKQNASGSESEEEEEEEEGDDDEFIDLLDVLDGKGEIDMGSDDESKRDERPTASTSKSAESGEDEDMEEDEHGSEEEEDEDEDEEMEIAPSDDEDAPEALDQLNDFVSGLDVSAKKRKAPEDETNDNTTGEPRTTRKRRLITKEKTEAGEENEFRAHTSGAKLNLDDLLAPLGGQSSTLQSLKKSTKILDPSSSSSSKTKAKALSAPLPQRIQERFDRQAAYEQTKEEVDKWTETMKRIREAEHLSFPLQAEGKSKPSNLELNAKFKPTTEMESAVDALLRSAKMREEDIHNTEDTMLKMNNLSVEEVAERRAELRKMRELMFRAEIKARRVKKIKSKTYRKIKRKEKERLGEKIDEDLGSDAEDGEAGKLKAEMDRARERATLRHKHTGKWATRMRGKEGLNEETRRDIEDMLARGEKLRRRIKGVGSDEDEDEDESSDDDDGLDAEAGIERIKEGAFNELKRLENDDENDGEEGTGKKGKSVFEMKFMKDAMARKALEANREVDDFIKEMGGTVHREGEDSDVEQEEMQEYDPSTGVLTQRAGGRLTFRPPTTTTHQSQPRTLATFSDTSSVTLKSTDLLSPPPASPTVTKKSELSNAKPQEQVNPWLVHDASADSSKPKLAKKVNEVVVSKDSKFAEKSKARLKKSAMKKAEEREKAADDAVVEISMDAVMTASTSVAPAAAPSASASKEANKKRKGASAKNGKAAVASQPAADNDDASDDDINVELEAQEQALAMKGKGKANGVTAFEQRDLVALAFAGDNVVQNFEEAKQREIAADAPREVDTTIPGWGSWGGTGAKKAPPKPQRIKKIAGIDPTTRADYGKKNIIISEKRDKKAGKYLVKDLPYPYTSKAQFARAMERPLGAEWNTRVGFQRGTLPKVVKKPGVIINPLEKQHT